MKVMVISLFLFLTLLNLVSAINLDFSFPDEVYQNEEFYVDIDNGPENGEYDVKIYVNNNMGEIASQIYGEKWQNSRYYLKAVYPEEKSFKLLVKNYTGEGEICVKLRESGEDSAIGEICKQIEILENKEEQTEIKDNEEESIILVNQFKENKEQNTENIITGNIANEEPIILNPKNEYNEYKTDEYKMRIGLISAFIILCLLLIILLALKRL